VRSKIFAASFGLALAGSALAMQPALAQEAAAPAAASFSAGAKVSDTKGGAVGTIAQDDGNFVVLKTDKHEVRLPKTSFTAHNGGFVIAMTQAEVNAAVEKSLAEASEKLAVGANVSGSQGAKIGTIAAIDDEYVTLKLTSGKQVRLPRNGIAPGPDGGIIGMTAAELEAAAAGAGAKASADAGKADKPAAAAKGKTD
jgi:preprotein translocase subunit YajC